MKASVRRLMGRSAAHSRRSFLKKAGLGAAAAGFWADSTLEAITQNVNTRSKPSDLKITDMRVAVVVGAPMTLSLIHI